MSRILSYPGLFNLAPSFPAQCAGRVTGAFHPRLATATTSPAAVAIEAHVIRAVAKRAGMQDAATQRQDQPGYSPGGSAAIIPALTGR